MFIIIFIIKLYSLLFFFSKIIYTYFLIEIKYIIIKKNLFIIYLILVFTFLLLSELNPKLIAFFLK